MSKALGSVLREARKHLKLTQDKVARNLGVSRAAVGQWENGEDPSTENLINICRDLGIELEYALKGVLKHQSGFEAVSRKTQDFISKNSDMELSVLEKHPYNQENFFIENNLIPFFPSSTIPESREISVTYNPMFFSTREPGLPEKNDLYMLSIVDDKMHPIIRKMSMVVVDGGSTPTVGQLVLLKTTDTYNPNWRVASSTMNKSQICLVGYLSDFSADGVVINQINPSASISVPMDQIAAIHSILPQN